MGAPKPALGYPSRTAAIAALREQGLSTREIARSLGMQSRDVISLEASARAYRRIRPNRETPATQRAVVFPVALMDRLVPVAIARGTHVNELIRRIVHHAVADGLIDAILDDTTEAAQ